MAIVPVAPHLRSNNLSGRKRGTIMHRYHADSVCRTYHLIGISRVWDGRRFKPLTPIKADNDRREHVAPSQFILPSLQFFFAASLPRPAVNSIIGNNDKKRGVNGVDTFPKSGTLAAAL